MSISLNFVKIKRVFNCKIYFYLVMEFIFLCCKVMTMENELTCWLVFVMKNLFMIVMWTP
jgi:hypothetical protein